MTPERLTEQPVTRPASAGNGWINLVSLLTLFAALYGLHGSDLEKVHLGFLVLYAVAAPVLLLELWLLRVHRRASTGLDWDRPAHYSLSRTLFKLFGLIQTLLGIAFLYWLLPEYHGGFYETYRQLLLQYGPWMLLIAVPYFYFIDGRMVQPEDGFWHMGRWFLPGHSPNRSALAMHWRHWLIKAFFLPLMFVYLTNNLGNLVHWRIPSSNDVFMRWYDLIYLIVMTIDLAFAAVGYILSMRLFDTHLRSADPTVLGWLVALMCYQPFYSVFDRYYLPYDDGFHWNIWLHGQVWLQAAWGTLVLLLLSVYTWATLSFGVRFSNLTHRGILTHGPFRFTKHPAYVSKNLSWWLIAIPFISAQGGWQAFHNCLLLLLLNGLYYLRAITEERHLSRDPTYVQYAHWIDQQGIFRFLHRPFPFLRYRPA